MTETYPKTLAEAWESFKTNGGLDFETMDATQVSMIQTVFYAGSGGLLGVLFAPGMSQAETYNAVGNVMEEITNYQESASSDTANSLADAFRKA